MPPPYWRSGGAGFQIADALAVLTELLERLPNANLRTSEALEPHYARYRTFRASQSDTAMKQFGDICDELWRLEHRIILKTQLVNLMAAIQAEELINKFCVFNLPRELVETLERLSPPEKLTAGASFLGRRKVRATSAYGGALDLMSWRNAFAHGHCVDRPLKSLRHNHLISPDEYPGVPDSIAEMLKLTAGYTRLADYIRRISLNPYTRRASSDWQEALEKLRIVGRYKFSGSRMVYDVTYA
jgi:hypothetical protein